MPFGRNLFFGARRTKTKETEERGNEEMEKIAGGSVGDGGGTVMRAGLWA